MLIKKKKILDKNNRDIEEQVHKSREKERD